MKTVKRELVHVGMFGPDGTVITKTDLADCNETFDGKCPISLGHHLADWMPKFGNVKSVEIQKDGESLVGDVEMRDELADAVDEKFYDDISVGIQTRKKDGKRYLHHVAFLGAVPPKIRDLKIFDDLGVALFEDEGTVSYTEKKEAADNPADQVAQAISRIADKARAAWAFEDVTKALGELVAWCTEMVASGAKIPDSLQEQIQKFSDEAIKKETPTIAPAMKAENDRLKKELADSKAQALEGVKSSLQRAMDGKVPKAKQGLVLSLADVLAGSESVELSDAEGKPKVSAIEVLKRVLESIPAPVKEGRVDLGDGPSPALFDQNTLKNKV